MTDWIKNILDCHGQVVILRTTEDDSAVRAFLQPVTQQREQETDQMTGLGSVDERLWMYLGRTAIHGGDEIFWNGMTFRVRSSRPYYIGDTPLYWWAMLETAREAAE